ncbi:MAG: cytochrome P450 [Rhizobiaceae bacterium]|nr:MAG: cytochrome P450 [Rhizobiaceae bacterium]
MSIVDISELDLVTLPIEDMAFAADPDPAIEEARRRHPWASRFSHGYVIHNYQAMRDLLPMGDKLHIAVGSVVEIMGARGSPWGNFMEDMMIAMRGADHRRVRGAVEPFFKPRSVVRHKERMGEVIGKLLDEWLPPGEFDFCQFASQFPITVMFGLIGGDPADLPRIQDALETQGLSYSMEASLLPDMEAAYSLMMDYTDELIAKRRASGEQDDLLQALIEAEDDGVLSPREVRELLYFLFGAGYDTSKNQLTLAVSMLMDRPDLWKRCAEDRQYCVLAVEEAFRLASPSNLPRVTLEDIVYEGVRIPTGTHLMFLTNVATRDPRIVEDMLVYNPERDQTNRHRAFGRGDHQCLGMHMARLQIEEALHLITQRMVNPLLVGPVTPRRFPGTWGIASLPIRFETVEASSALASA